MNWYAVRTTPGAQMPQREYRVVGPATEKINPNWSRGKGYRIVPSLNPRVSAIERALNNIGISHYMPAEKRLVRDRLKTDLWKVRRFPLLTGYIFIRDPVDWLKLSEAPGVAGVVGTRGKPLPVDLMDILMLRTKEAEAEVEFDKTQRNAIKAVKRKAKNGNVHLRKFAAQLEAAEVMDIGAVAIQTQERAA